MNKKWGIILVILLILIIERIRNNPEFIEELQQFIENGMKR